MSDESNTLKAQTEAKVAAGRKGNSDFMKGVDETIAQAKAFQQGANALDLNQIHQVLSYQINMVNRCS